MVRTALSVVAVVFDESAGSAPTPDGLPQAAKHIAPIARNFRVRMSSF
jgi:hypothetical protein